MKNDIEQIKLSLSDFSERLAGVLKHFSALEDKISALEVAKETKAPLKTSGRSDCVENANYFVTHQVDALPIESIDKRLLLEADRGFIDAASAELSTRRDNLVYQLREVCRKYPVDWGDEHGKHYIAWNMLNGRYFIADSGAVRLSSLPHCSSAGALMEFANGLSPEDVKLLVFGVE